MESQSLTSLAGTIKCTVSVTPEVPSSTLQLIGATTHALVVLPHTPTVCVIAFCGSRGQSTSAKRASVLRFWVQEQERFAASLAVGRCGIHPSEEENKKPLALGAGRETSRDHRRAQSN